MAGWVGEPRVVAWRERFDMPVLRYFLFVGGALLTLLFVADACLPTLPVTENAGLGVDHSIIRIRSDRKWPERIVFDTTRPTVAAVPAPVAISIAEASPSQKRVAAQSLKGQVQEAFAQVRPNPNEVRHSEPKRKPRVVKSNVGPQRLRVAQQPVPFSFFGNSIW
jgi:hypothetical protein